MKIRSRQISPMGVKEVIRDAKPQETVFQGMTVERENPTGSKYNAFGIGSNVKKAPMPRRLKFKLDNSGGGTATTYYMFDAAGIVKAIKADSLTAAALTNKNMTMTIVNAFLKGRSFLFENIRAEVSSSSTQFDNPLNIVGGTLDGEIYRDDNIDLEDAVGPDQENSKIQYYNGTLSISECDRVQLEVNAGETVLLTFNFKAITNLF
jgi:hypothetical protein